MEDWDIYEGGYITLVKEDIWQWGIPLFTQDAVLEEVND